MIYIKKQTEPRELVEIRSTGLKDFDALPSDKKELLRRSLLEEQGYLCAYCMQRINDNSDMKIEHYIPRNDNNQLAYSNLLAVCKGNEGKRFKEQTCDTHKGQNYLSINPQNLSDIATIEYSSLGKISSSSEIYNKELNETLNLNCNMDYRINNRKAALDTIKMQLARKDGSARVAFIRKMLNLYSNKNNQGQYAPYLGIILWYLNKKIKRL